MLHARLKADALAMGEKLKKCIDCKSDNRAIAVFCGSCGAKFLAEPIAARVEVPSDEHSITATRKISRLLPILAGTAALALLLVLGSYVYLQSAKSASIPHASLSASLGEQPISSPSPSQTVPTRSVSLNSFGIPTTCDVPEFVALASDILKNQMHSKGDISLSSIGFAASQLDAANNGGSMPSTTDPNKFKHLACSYSADLDGYGYYNHMVNLDFDASSYSRDGSSAFDEQEILLNAGEDHATYYPSGGGWSEGGGLRWIIWISDATVEVNTWSAEGAHGEVLDQALIGNVLGKLDAGT